ncbi:S8 family serine peptidase [Bacillus tianshenii]|nr:S8 family serine peptidase [Bacillus tianshenii]
MRKLTRMIVLCCLVMVFASGEAAAEQLSEKEKQEARSEEVLVKYKGNNVSTFDKGEEQEYLEHVQMRVLKVKDKAKKQQLMKEWKTRPDVVVEENQPRYVEKVNDPYLNYQWSIPFLELPYMWHYNSSEVVRIAVIDSGVNINHPDLLGRMVSGGYNFIDNNMDISDVHGHGTAVSGVIGATINNREGIAGVTGGVPIEILPLRVTFSDGTGYTSDIIRAINYAIEQEVDVINISMGSTAYSELEREAINTAIEDGIIVVAAAGNNGNNTYSYPASYQNVLSIGSVGESGKVSTFSNFNDRVVLTAPGEKILTTTRDGGYEFQYGTSFSTPIVAGTAAVLKSFYPEMNQQDVLNTFIKTAEDRGVPGKDDYYGYGIVQPLDALQSRLYINWNAHYDVDYDKIWHVRFNVPMDANSFESSNVFVLNEAFELVDVDVSLSEDKETVVIKPPRFGYRLGEQYTLYLEADIASAAGLTMNKPVMMEFTIEQ